jgi:ABC-2 type transport system permease protein
MRAVLDYSDAALAVVKRDILVFRSYRLRFVGTTVSGFASVAVFYYVSRLVNVQPFRDHDAYFAYAVVGLVTMQVLFATVGALPGRVRQELVAGTFERFVVSPFGATAGVVSMAIFPFILSLTTAAITISFAAVVFGMPLRWDTAPLAIPVAVAGCLAFAPFALIGAGLVVLVKQAQSGLNFVVTGISFIAGFIFPVALLPGWIRWTSEVQPFTPTVQLLRNSLAGTPMGGSLSLALLKIGVAAAVLLPVSIWLLAVGIRASQRQGTVIEY